MEELKDNSDKALEQESGALASVSGPSTRMAVMLFGPVSYFAKSCIRLCDLNGPSDINLHLLSPLKIPPVRSPP